MLLLYCVTKPFTMIVIPGLTKPAPCLTRGNPVRQDWFPAFAGTTSGFLLEFIPTKIGAGMTVLVPHYMERSVGRTPLVAEGDNFHRKNGIIHFRRSLDRVKFGLILGAEKHG